MSSACGGDAGPPSVTSGPLRGRPVDGGTSLSGQNLTMPAFPSCGWRRGLVGLSRRESKNEPTQQTQHALHTTLLSGPFSARDSRPIRFQSSGCPFPIAPKAEQAVVSDGGFDRLWFSG